MISPSLSGLTCATEICISLKWKLQERSKIQVEALSPIKKVHVINHYDPTHHVSDLACSHHMMIWKS